MRILLIVDSFLPEPKATGPMFASLATELTRRGHTATILTVAEQTAPYTVEQTDYATVIRVRAPRLKGVNLVLRGLRELRLSTLVWNNARSVISPLHADLIAFYSPTIFWGPLVRRLKKLWRARTVLILRDMFPQWALDAGEIRRGPHYTVLSRYADLQYSVADIIGIQSPGNRAFFEQQRPQFLPRTSVLYNWVSASSANDKPTELRKQLGIAATTPIFLYGGNLGPAQDPALLAALANRLGDRAHILVVGEGLAFRELESSATQLRNLSAWHSVAQERFLAIAAQCDIGLILLNRNLKTHNVPGKLLTYLQARIPVLASLNRGNDLAELIETHHAGVACWADEPDRFLEHAEKLLDPAFRRSLSVESLARVFSVEAAADFLVAAAKA